jgi:murein DD-endopeptidase MepM/ murein hydrolase activator NlpD
LKQQSYYPPVRSIAGVVALWAALVSPGATAAENNAMLAPVEPACVSSPFGPRTLADRPLAGTFHPGIDLPAPLGAPVRAVAPGRIIRIQRHGVGGLEMLVQHDGFVGIYSHLGLISPTILNGRKTVTGGQQVATVGRSGLTYGPHLYFGILVNGHPVNPAPLLGVGACGGTPAAITDARVRPTRLFAVQQQTTELR